MYDPRIVDPMRAEAVKLGCTELRTSADVHTALKGTPGTVLVFVNSVCGCAAGGARPGLGLALRHGTKPSKVYTVFAGQDKEATSAAREYFLPWQPSSPQIGLLKDGKLVHMLQRHDIEGRSPEMIAAALTGAFDTHCA
jgi:putative YphP/YqiW family bacilliredoxin